MTSCGRFCGHSSLSGYREGIADEIAGCRTLDRRRITIHGHRHIRCIRILELRLPRWINGDTHIIFSARGEEVALVRLQSHAVFPPTHTVSPIFVVAVECIVGEFKSAFVRQSGFVGDRTALYRCGYRDVESVDQVFCGEGIRDQIIGFGIDAAHPCRVAVHGNGHIFSGKYMTVRSLDTNRHLVGLHGFELLLFAGGDRRRSLIPHHTV